MRASVDLDALTANLARLRQAAGGQRVLAVVKANAYGHGLLTCAGALAAPGAGSAGLAVARLTEAVQLREAGVGGRVVVLGGCTEPRELPVFAEHSAELVVQGAEQVRWLECAPPVVRVKVWLKVDSGMNRLGVLPGQVRALWQRLAECPRVLDRPRLMTHLANADDRDDPYTLEQVRAFDACVGDLPGERSIANSAGVLGFPQTRADWVRPGIALYGISPFSRGTGVELGLRPVMTLVTRLLSVKEIPAGVPVGYGGIWRSPESMRIGVAAIGYADGYPRSAPAGTPVLVEGARAKVVGRVSMDLLTVDLRGIPAARVGSEVVVWGGELPVEEVARAIECSPYELVAGLGRRVEYPPC